MRERRNPASAKLARGGQIRQEELKEAAVIDAIVDGLVIVDTDGKIIVVNPALEKLTGYKKSEIVGKNVVDLMKKVVKTEDLEKAMKGLRTALKGKLFLPSETLALVTKEGREISVIITTSFMKYSGGKPSTVIFVLKDNTERKRVEDALKESEQRFRAIFDNAKDGILVADIETKKFYLANKAICKMLGYSQEDIKNLGVMDIHHKEDLPHAMEQFEKLAKKDIKVAENVLVKRNDGSVFYADIAASLFGLNGKPSLIGIFRDITERKKVEKERLIAAADRQRIHQLEKFAKVAVGRELKMVELKQRIKALESKLKGEITGKG